MTDRIKVLFVKSPDFHDEITAVFPYELGENRADTMNCYAHMGQHSSCCEDWVVEQKKASESEYEDLLDELTSIGYNVEVIKKFPRLHSWRYRKNLLKG